MTYDFGNPGLGLEQVKKYQYSLTDNNYNTSVRYFYTIECYILSISESICIQSK